MYVSSAVRSASTFRFLGRTFLALVFAPEPPLSAWLEELDAWLVRSTGFFSEKPVVLDLSRLSLTQLDYIGLMTELEIRKIRVISVEGIDPSWRDPSHAPLGNGGRSANVIEFPEPPPPEAKDSQTDIESAPPTGGTPIPSQQPDPEAMTRQASANAGTDDARSRTENAGTAPNPAVDAAAADEDATSVESVEMPAGSICSTTAERLADLAPSPGASSLLLETSVRSGQSVFFPNGDVTVVGSVASGAEIVAGGSIHVYGALRGRAIAGSNGNSKARVFCGRLEAELVAIDGLYKTADDMDTALRGQAVQAWLEGEVMMLKSQG